MNRETIRQRPLNDLLSAYNRSEVARRLGVSISTVQRWFHGHSYPRGAHLQKIAEMLGVDASSIDLSPSQADPHRDTTLTSRGGRRGVHQRAS